MLDEAWTDGKCVWWSAPTIMLKKSKAFLGLLVEVVVWFKIKLMEYDYSNTWARDMPSQRLTHGGEVNITTIG